MPASSPMPEGPAWIPAPVSVPEVSPVTQEGPPELADQYGIDRLVLLVRDPYWVYAWWELTEARLGESRSKLGQEGQVVLRLYDISLIEWDGQNHHEHFDIEVNDRAGNWYIQLDNPGASFCAELGLRTSDGRFFCMIRSNFVTLPRDSMSNVVDEEWMVLEEDYRKLFELSGGGSIGLGSGEILRMLEERLRHELSSGMVSSFGISSAAALRKKDV